MYREKYGERYHIKPFSRKDIEIDGELEPIHASGWANAVIFKLKLKENKKFWIFKDFKSRNILVRNTIGRFLIFREFKIINKLKGITGIPEDAFPVDEYSLAYRFIEGTNLRKAISEGRKISKNFFEKLEDTVRQIHKRGIVHLDLRNAENIIISQQDEPFIVDFQSALELRYFPLSLANMLCNIDLAGIYKHWKKVDSTSMNEDRIKLLDKMNKYRKLWPFRGYFIQHWLSKVKKSKYLC